MSDSKPWSGAHTVTAPSGADGDVLVRSGSSWAALAKGTTGQQLIVRSDGTVAWVDPPAVHVRAWGATGDGSDQTTACQNATNQANANGGGEVRFSRSPAGGTYTISSLKPYSNITFRGDDGVVLKLKTGSNTQLFRNGNTDAGIQNVSWRNLRFQGDSTTVGNGSSQMAIYCRSSDGLNRGLTVDGCRVDQFAGAGIYLEGQELHIRGNTVTRCTSGSGAYNAIIATAQLGTDQATFGKVEITGNLVDGAYDAQGGAGIDVALIGTGYFARAVIAENVVRNMNQFAGIAAEANGSYHQISITDNVIIRCGGVGIQANNTGGVVPQYADFRGATIADNLVDCEDLTGVAGIICSLSNAAVTGNSLRVSARAVTMAGQDGTHRASNGLLEGNNIVNAGAGTDHLIVAASYDQLTINGNPIRNESGATYLAGISATDCVDLVIDGNPINTPGRQGIVLVDCPDASTRDNRIFDANGANSTYAGIQSSGNAGVRQEFRDNTVIDRRGTPQMRYGLDVSGITSGTTHAIENEFLGWVTGSINGRTNLSIDRDNITDVKGSAYWDDFDAQTGRLAPSARGWFFGTLALTASRAYFVRYVPRRDETVTAIGFNVTSLDAGNPNVDVGIYDSSLNRLVSSGATAGKLNATGTQSVTIATTTLKANTVYYVAIASASNTAQLIAASVANGGGTRMFGAGTPTQMMGISSTDTFMPLPAAAAIQNNQNAIALAVRES